MRCLPELTVATDHPIWVRRDAFFAHFDQADFYCREAQVVQKAYLADWFHSPAPEHIHFMLPAFQILRGKTEFISGRHRVAVLLDYLSLLPMAVVRVDQQGEPLLDRIIERPLRLDEYIDLPDLPIVESFASVESQCLPR